MAADGGCPNGMRECGTAMALISIASILRIVRQHAGRVFAELSLIQCGGDVCVSNASMTTCAETCSDNSECSSGMCTANGCLRA